MTVFHHIVTGEHTLDVIYEQRERVFGYPGETRARVGHMASQMIETEGFNVVF